MIMSRTIAKAVIVAAALLLASFAAGAQAYSGYAPYSIFGIGDTFTQGTAYNRSMGGVGIATRNNRFINPLNPAAVTARDSLAFMADYSVYGENKIFRQGDMTSANNAFNIGDLIMSFPIYGPSAMMVGIMPYSTTGYGYSFYYDDPSVIGNTGNINYAAGGRGSIYKLFADVGVTLWDRLSLGVEADYYFGNIVKEYAETFSNSSYNSMSNGFNMQLTAFGVKAGVQYEQKLGSKAKLTLGATYSLDSDIDGYVEGYKYSAGEAATDTLYHKIDTLSSNPGRVKLAGELGVGINFKYADKFSAEFNYTRSDWTDCGFASVQGFACNTVSRSGVSAFGTTCSEAYRLGVEYVPNRNDIRYYFKRVTYRAGAYYKKDYYTVDGKGITSAGLTFGMTLPVFRWYNGLTLGVELCQRGSINDNLIRERYFNFTVGMNIFDIWFQHPKYE